MNTPTTMNYAEYRSESATYIAKSLTRLGQESAEEYYQLGLLSELGELAALLKRRIRDGVEPSREQLVSELGDVLWYAARLDPRQPLIDSKIKNATFIDAAALMQGDIPYAWYGHLVRQTLGEWNAEVLDEIMAANLAKLAGRAQRGTIQGSGDDR